LSTRRAAYLPSSAASSPIVTWTVAGAEARGPSGGAEARAASGDRDGCGDWRRLWERCDLDRAVVPCNAPTHDRNVYRT